MADGLNASKLKNGEGIASSGSVSSVIWKPGLICSREYRCVLNNTTGEIMTGAKRGCGFVMSFGSDCGDGLKRHQEIGEGAGRGGGIISCWIELYWEEVLNRRCSPKRNDYL